MDKDELYGAIMALLQEYGITSGYHEELVGELVDSIYPDEG